MVAIDSCHPTNHDHSLSVILLGLRLRGCASSPNDIFTLSFALFVTASWADAALLFLLYSLSFCFVPCMRPLSFNWGSVLVLGKYNSSTLKHQLASLAQNDISSLLTAYSPGSSKIHVTVGCNGQGQGNTPTVRYFVLPRSRSLAPRLSGPPSMASSNKKKSI